MNTELLRKDELYKPWPSESGLKDWINLVELLRQRLVEEREKNAQWTKWGIVEIAVRNPRVAEYCSHWEERAEKAESELSSARWLYNEAAGELRRTLAELAEARKDSERLDWLFKCQTVTLTIGKSGLRGYVLDRAAIDAAMKEER